jgi:hypothetical protein
MRTRLLPLAGLLALLAALAAPARESRAPGGPELVKAQPGAGKAVQPTVVVRLKALAEVIDDARYLFALAGQAELGKQFEAMLKKRTGKKGLDGIDPKKPLGLYATLKANVQKSEAVLLLPIADEKAFLSLLENLDIMADKGKDGLYTAEVEKLPFPVIFRFANGYLYGTLKAGEQSADLLAKEKLPLPAAVLGAGGSELLALTINFDRVPDQLKQLAEGFIDQGIDQAKDQEPPNETAAQKAVREAVIDEAGRQLKALLNEGTSLKGSLNIDRKANDLALAIELKGKKGSGLAKDLAALGAFKSVAAGLVNERSAANATLAVRLPEAVRKHLGKLVDEHVKQALANEEDKGKRELMRILLEALAPTGKSGTFDLSVDLRAPGKAGKYALLLGTRVTDGEGVEKAVRKVVAKLPDEVKEAVKFDVEKVKGVNVHRITPPEGSTPENVKALLGEGPVYFAVRKDALFVSLGEDALAALKGAMAAAPTAGQPLQVEVSLARVAKLMAKAQKAAPEAAQKAFKAPGSDKVRLTIEGGDSLRLRLSAKARVVTFLGALKKAEEE